MNYISEEELKKYGNTSSLSEKARALVCQQKATWDLAGVNYRNLEEVQTRSFSFGYFRIDCQYNPGRIRSSAANTHPDAILARPCFLCAGNRPAMQTGIHYRGDFTVLVNPFPIFPMHLTIPLNTHLPQLIAGNAEALIDLSRELNDFTVFYNGPHCGASAPDHFHFQAGLKGTLPIEQELEFLLKNHAELLKEENHLQIFAVENYLRRMVCLISKEKKPLVIYLEKLIRLMSRNNREEPMMNILVWYSEPGWNVAIFPRSRQRPRQYFSDDPDKLVISPAAVELGGLVILPRGEDFYKITEPDLVSVFSQVTIQEQEFRELRVEIIADF